MRWGQLEGQEQVSRTPAAPKNVGRANETSGPDQAIKEAEARYAKQLRLKYQPTIEAARGGINIKPMRAYALAGREDKLSWPMTAQPKYDGCRSMAYYAAQAGLWLMSRGGLEYVMPHITEELNGRVPPGWSLDGELYVHGMPLQTIRHHIETYTEESLQVQLVCYDMVNFSALEMPWKERQEYLTDFFVRNPGLRYTRMTPSIEVPNMEDLDALHDRWVGDGYEGLIARDLDGPYKLASKNTKLLKYKKFEDDEFLILSWSLGKDGIIQYTCQVDEQHTVEARPRGTAEMRAQMLEDAKAGKAVGKYLTIRFIGRSLDNIPLHPHGVAIRQKRDMDQDEKHDEDHDDK
jgi:DNA ligase-1